MNELIKITYQNDEPAVSARDLHEFLEVETPYHKWFPRMCEYGFAEGEDYYSILSNRSDGLPGKPRQDAILTLDMAKELCMLQRNEKGKQARKYFIQLEKDWHDPQKVLARVMPEVWDQVNALEKRMNDLTAVNDLLLDLDTRLTQLERRLDGPSGLMSISDIRPFTPAPAGAERASFTPGLAARKRWMRTTSEKLDMMSARFNTSHNEILHGLYQHLEKRCDVVLEEEKLRAMEDHDLADCSILTAIFYNPELRYAFEENIDYNLAPENRGW